MYKRSNTLDQLWNKIVTFINYKISITVNLKLAKACVYHIVTAFNSDGRYCGETPFDTNPCSGRLSLPAAICGNLPILTLPL